VDLGDRSPVSISYYMYLNVAYGVDTAENKRFEVEGSPWEWDGS
jgi:hypothetical protein